MEALRVEGNALFTAKQYAEAMVKYSQALALGAGELSVKEADAQRVLLWSNRAACALQLEQFAAAADDCSKALEVDHTNEKARYRRAQAYVGLAKYTEAFQDVRLVLAVNPTNKAVVALARKIKDVVSSDVHGVQKALDAVAKGTERDVAAQQKLTEEALKFLEMKCVQDLASLPREVDEKGGLTILWRAVAELLALATVDDETKRAAESVLSHVVALLAILASASLPLASRVFERGGGAFSELLVLLHHQVELSYASSAPSAAGLQLSTAGRKHIIKLAAFVFKYLMLSSDDDAAIRSVLKGMLDGLRSREVDLEISGLDGILHFVSTPTVVEGAATEDDRIKQRKVRFGTLVHEVGLFPLLHETASIALHMSTADEPRFDVLLSRLPLVFTQCLAQFESNETVLRTLVRDFCVAPVLAASVADRTSLEKATASCLLLSALFLQNAKLALWAVQQTGNDGTLFLARLGEFLEMSRTFTDERARTRRFQEIWVDCVASVCGVEGGTGCVPATLRVEIYKMLKASLEDADLVLRASALSIQIKIGIVEKAFETESVDSQFLIDQVFEVLEKAHDYEKTALEHQLHWSGASPKERGIEALSYVITLTHVKDEFVKHPKAIKSLFDVEFASTKDQSSDRHAHVGYRSNVYYGIGYILHHALTSEATLKKKQMEGMELTPDQYEELQKALRQKSALDDGDSPEKVQLRVKKLVNTQEVLTTLVKLLKYATTKSMNVLEMAVLSALHAAEVAEVRGKLVQSGVFQSLIPLSMQGLAQAEADKSKKTGKVTTGTKLSNAAGHAIAKILISTNPNLISSSSLFSSIKPLLELCKGDTQLLQFESLMALTNIASVSEETKNRIVSEPQGLSTLQYLQFSEHELVRRAATETICNLLPNQQIIEKIFMNEEKIRLWLAFASVEEEQEDFETARAAAGALAMVSQVHDVSWLLMEHGALQAFARVLELLIHEDTVHRALFAMENMLLTLNDNAEAEKAELKSQYVTSIKTDLKDGLVKSLKNIVVGTKHAPPTKEAAQSCLGALIKCIGK